MPELKDLYLGSDGRIHRENEMSVSLKCFLSFVAGAGIMTIIFLHIR